MKVLIFLHGTLIMHPAAVGLPRHERVQQVTSHHASVTDYNNYLPVGRAVEKCRVWAAQGATLVYLSSHDSESCLRADRSVLAQFNFPIGEVHFRLNGESYRDVATRIAPDVIIEDDCESIGGMAEMVWPNLPEDQRSRIQSWVVKEFEGIDELPDALRELCPTAKAQEALGLKRGTVSLSSYSASWPQQFLDEAERVGKVLSDRVFPFEHVGSTAVPALVSKPIIDFMGGVGSIEDARALIQDVESLGYEYRPNGDKPDRILLVKGPPSCRTHHFSLVVRDSKEWRDLLRFRDTLRNEPALAEEYARLKQILAAQYSADRPTYTAQKAAFIRKVLMPNFRIRAATTNDADQMAKAHVDAWHQAYRGLVPDSFLARLTYEKRAQRWRTELTTAKEETYIAQEDGRCIGFVTLGAARDSDSEPNVTGEIWGIYIAPAHWRCGVGRALAQHAERLLRSRGFKEVTLWVFQDNAQARRFYESCGFVLDGASKVEDYDKPLAVIRYRKNLS